jgi:hypothetical protein
MLLESFSQFLEPIRLVAPHAITIALVVWVESCGGVVYRRLVEPVVVIVELPLGSF